MIIKTDAPIVIIAITAIDIVTAWIDTALGALVVLGVDVTLCTIVDGLRYTPGFMSVMFTVIETGQPVCTAIGTLQRSPRLCGCTGGSDVLCTTRPVSREDDEVPHHNE